MHDPRLRNERAGYFFDVMTRGFGQMPDYAAQVVAEGSLGDRRLHPRAAAQPARDASATCRQEERGRLERGETGPVPEPAHGEPRPRAGGGRSPEA